MLSPSVVGWLYFHDLSSFVQRSRQLTRGLVQSDQAARGYFLWPKENQYIGDMFVVHTHIMKQPTRCPRKLQCFYIPRLNVKINSVAPALKANLLSITSDVNHFGRQIAWDYAKFIVYHTLCISSHSNPEAAQSENRGIPCGLPEATTTIPLSPAFSQYFATSIFECLCFS